MAQIVRKVTFAEDGAPAPRMLAVGMEGDNNARLIKLAVPHITEGQQVYVTVEVGGVSDTVRLYPDADGLYGWSVEASALHTFGGGYAQVKAFDALDPLKPKWQSGRLGLSIGASMDVDTDLSYQYPTAIEQMEAEMQRVEAATKASEQAARQSEIAAAQSAQSAAQSEQNAARSEQNAAQSEHNAGTSEQNAAQSAQDARTSEQSAAQSAQDARRSAEEAAATAMGDMDVRYLKKSEFTPETVRDNLKQADGHGSGVDADTLDRWHRSDFAAALHSHAILEVTGLTQSLDQKADAAHTQAAGTITEGVFNGRVLANTDAIAALTGRQVRNIIISPSEPTQGVHDGDIWLRYTT